MRQRWLENGSRKKREKDTYARKHLKKLINVMKTKNTYISFCSNTSKSILYIVVSPLFCHSYWLWLVLSSIWCLNWILFNGTFFLFFFILFSYQSSSGKSKVEARNVACWDVLTRLLENFDMTESELVAMHRVSRIIFCAYVCLCFSG